MVLYMRERMVIRMQSIIAGGVKAQSARGLMTVRVLGKILHAMMSGASIHVMNITMIVCINVGCGAVLCFWSIKQHPERPLGLW